VLFIACRSALHWTYTKRRLSFCVVTLDCEDEGCLRLHQLPTPEQANVIRDILGIHKRREVSAAELERLKALLLPRSRAARRAQSKILPSAIVSYPTAIPDQTPILFLSRHPQRVLRNRRYATRY
jgi:hypothetical protein